MLDKIKKSTLIYLSVGVFFPLIPVLSWAMLSVQTDVVSGNITNKHADRSVKLDNGKTYRPSRDELVIDLKVGAPVTLRYMVEDSINIFFEFAPGLDSLEKVLAEPPDEDTNPK
jgi:hypothetical protein